MKYSSALGFNSASVKCKNHSYLSGLTKTGGRPDLAHSLQFPDSRVSQGDVVWSCRKGPSLRALRFAGAEACKESSSSCHHRMVLPQLEQRRFSRAPEAPGPMLRPAFPWKERGMQICRWVRVEGMNSSFKFLADACKHGVC